MKPGIPDGPGKALGNTFGASPTAPLCKSPLWNPTLYIE